MRQFYTEGNTLSRRTRAGGVTPRESHGTAVGGVLAPGVFSGSPKARTAVGGVPERPNAAATKRAAKDVDRYAAGHDTGRPDGNHRDDGSSDLTALMRSFKTLRLRAARRMAHAVCVSATSPA